LLLPLGASLGASFVLFLVSCGRVFLPAEGRPPFWSAYRSFLTLFWMTAPLAWLYAVPYERFLSEAGAMSANLWTLGLVAAWRVALMVRVVTVIADRGVVAAVLLVMLFADGVAIAAATQVPLPQVFSLMGGGRSQTESERIMGEAAMSVLMLGSCTAPVWVIGGLMNLFTGRAAWQVPAAPAEPAGSGRGMWLLAVGSVLIWLPILPLVQAEQLLRWRVERDMRGGRIAEGLELMSRRQQSDFPPGWDPPPRIGYGEKSPHILEVMDVLLAQQPASWVRGVYAEKLRRYIVAVYIDHSLPKHPAELPRIVRILQQIPEGPGIAAAVAPEMESRLSDARPTAEERENVEAMLELAGKGTPRQR
jgi:hypothetical protein